MNQKIKTMNQKTTIKYKTKIREYLRDGWVIQGGKLSLAKVLGLEFFSKEYNYFSDIYCNIYFRKVVKEHGNVIKIQLLGLFVDNDEINEFYV